MTRRKIFLYVFVSLIAVAVLVAGGYALYRLGVAHGAAGSSPFPLERRFVPDINRKGVPELWHWRGHGGFPFVFFIPRLFSTLFFVGIIALAIYGGIKLLRLGSRNERQIVDSQPKKPGSPVDDPPSME